MNGVVRAGEFRFVFRSLVLLAVVVADLCFLVYKCCVMIPYVMFLLSDFSLHVLSPISSLFVLLLIRFIYALRINIWSSLYASCQWDDKAIRRLIGDGKLAARLKGKEDATVSDHECPICFFNYSEINVTKCCSANICTECFLQVKPQKSSSKNKQGKVNQHNCPFCNATRFQVSVATAPTVADGVGTGTMTEQALSPSADQQQQQKQDGSHTLKDGTTTPPSEQSSSPKISTPPTTGFGSHLERNARVAMMRARSSSMSESQSNSTLQSPEQEISSLAMTPEERRALELEMRAQHNHPLTMRLEQEEAERRMRNEMEYYHQRMMNNRAGGGRRTIADVRRQAATASGGSSGGAGTSLNPLPPRGGRDWNRLVDALEQRSSSNNNGGGDDLVVLEAALMLSMEEDARRRGEPPPRSSNLPTNAINNFDRSRFQQRLHHHVIMSEEEQLAMAIAASLREQSAAAATGDGNGNDDNSNNQENNSRSSDNDSDEA